MVSKRLIYIAVCMVAILTTSAHTGYRTAELQRLATALALDETKLKEGENYLLLNKQPIIVCVKNNTVSHIGLRLFSKEMRNAGNSPIFNFLERYFLQLKYQPTDKTAQKMISDDQFMFVVGSINTIDIIRLSDDFAFNYDKRRYTATWTRAGLPLLSVSFPVEYELISGENKIEAENNLMSDIINTVITEFENKSAYDAYYINDNFSSRLYYQKGKLVNSVRHPAETVSNMMLSLQAKGAYDMDVTQILYGFKKTVFNIPLRQWIAFCKKNNCHLYIGIDEMNADGDVKAVVIAVNESENYNHVLTIDVPLKVIQAQSGVIEASLYPYVPTHNVKELFGKYRKSNPKMFVSK